jgi:hypothetical protein
MVRRHLCVGVCIACARNATYFPCDLCCPITPVDLGALAWRLVSPRRLIVGGNGPVGSSLGRGITVARLILSLFFLLVGLVQRYLHSPNEKHQDPTAQHHSIHRLAPFGSNCFLFLGASTSGRPRRGRCGEETGADTKRHYEDATKA